LLLLHRALALPKWQKLIGYRLTKRWMNDYYLTYPVTAREGITAALKPPKGFIESPPPVLRKKPSNSG